MPASSGAAPSDWGTGSARSDPASVRRRPPGSGGGRDAALLHLETLVGERHLLHRDVGPLRVQGPARMFDDASAQQLPRHHARRAVLVHELDHDVAKARRIAVPDLVEPQVEVERADDPALERDVAHPLETRELARVVLLLVAVPVLDDVHAHGAVSYTH